MIKIVILTGEPPDQRETCSIEIRVEEGHYKVEAATEEVIDRTLEMLKFVVREMLEQRGLLQ